MNIKFWKVLLHTHHQLLFKIAFPRLTICNLLRTWTLIVSAQRYTSLPTKKMIIFTEGSLVITGSTQFILKELEDFDIDFCPETNSSSILRTLLKRVTKGLPKGTEQFSPGKGLYPHQ